MRLLKVTAEYRAESEEEAKQMNEDFKEEARKQGYILNSFSYIWNFNATCSFKKKRIFGRQYCC